MKKKFAVLGLGHFGLNLSLQLTERGCDVLAVDNREERVELLRDKVAHTVIADTRDVKALRSLGLEDMDAVVVAIGEDFESSILTTAHLQELGIKRIVNRVVSPVHEKLLKTMNIEDRVLPEADAAHHLSRRLTMRGVVDALELSEDYSIIEVKVPPSFIGKSLRELEIRNSFNINLVTVIRCLDESRAKGLSGKQSLNVLGVPNLDLIFAQNDILVVFGREKDLTQFSLECEDS